MPCVRHIIVCEGESEHAYLQRLQSFLEAQTPDPVPLRFIVPHSGIAGNGTFSVVQSAYKRTRREQRNSSIRIWIDFDLYHRDDRDCAKAYKEKPAGIPDFHFSFHNFEDFLALHLSGDQLAIWLQYGSPAGRNHFAVPLHSENYEPEIERIFPGYRKGTLSPDFISWTSLQNLKANLHHQPSSNPHNLHGIRSFAEFLIDQIEQAYPDKLSPASVCAAAPLSSP